MTTIAWDGKTLAADRAAWSGGNKYRVRKVHRIKAPDGRMFLVAFCGSGAFANRVLRWMSGGPHPGSYPTQDDICIGIAVDERRRIWRLEAQGLHWCQVNERVHACGGGQDFAIGALEAGATAVQAIQIATKRSDMAGLGVDSVRF